VAITTGAIAAKNDIRQGNYIGAALDLAGAIPGAGALGALKYARWLREAADADQALGWTARNAVMLGENLSRAAALLRLADRIEAICYNGLGFYAAWNATMAISPFYKGLPWSGGNGQTASCQ
jgi:hypothetical protein